jgi:hypothetical protein
MSEIDRARAMLPLVPPEVFDQFFEPLITRDIGWPFASVDSSLQGTDWLRILHPFTLRDIHHFRWVRNSFLLDKSLLHADSQADISFAILNQTEDIWAKIGRDSEPCRRSTAWHKASILSTGRFCAPVTLARAVGGIKILDGNHRIAALLDLGVQCTVPVDAWIGIPPVV